MKIIFCHQFGREVGYCIAEEAEMPLWKQFLKLKYLTGYILDGTKKYWLHLIPKKQGELTIWEFGDKPFDCKKYSLDDYFHVAAGEIKDLVVLSIDDLMKSTTKEPTKLGITIGEI